MRMPVMCAPCRVEGARVRQCGLHEVAGWRARRGHAKDDAEDRQAAEDSGQQGLSRWQQVGSMEKWIGDVPYWSPYRWESLEVALIFGLVRSSTFERFTRWQFGVFPRVVWGNRLIQAGVRFG